MQRGDQAKANLDAKTQYDSLQAEIKQANDSVNAKIRTLETQYTELESEVNC